MTRSRRQSSMARLIKNSLKLKTSLVVSLNSRSRFHLIQKQLLFPSHLLRKCKRFRIRHRCKRSQMCTIRSKDPFSPCLIIQEIIIISKSKLKKRIIKFRPRHKTQGVGNLSLFPKRWTWHTFKTVMTGMWTNQLTSTHLIKSKSKKFRNLSCKAQWLLIVSRLRTVFKKRIRRGNLRTKYIKMIIALSTKTSASTSI